jgi:hypothetical protein
VYCLRREAWGRVIAEFDIEHFLPVSYRPESEPSFSDDLDENLAKNGISAYVLTPSPIWGV